MRLSTRQLVLASFASKFYQFRHTTRIGSSIVPFVIPDLREGLWRTR